MGSVCAHVRMSICESVWVMHTLTLLLCVCVCHHLAQDIRNKLPNTKDSYFAHVVK